MGWKPIVVGVDGSPESLRAAAMGAMIAAQAAVECRLVHVVPDFYATTAAAECGVDVSVLEDGAVAHGTALVRSTLAGHVSDDVIDRLEVRVGRPAIALATAAHQLDAELVVLGGKHHRGLDRIAGSTITQMVRTSHLPLLATDGGQLRIERVLAAVDLSYAAKPTLEEAERWAALFGARLRVMNVVEPVPLIPGIPAVIDDEDYFRSTERLLESTVWPLITFRDAERVVRHGRAAATIAEEVVEWKADLLVVGSHGRGWVDRLLMGSASERLLQVLPTATLVIPVARPADAEAVRAVPAAAMAGAHARA